ncbi:MAG: aspartate-semialdehyde dehydrogenase [Myxococcales bacterium]|nr:aspartate-semialdehyde dehydrogenase [Myxococcales bacterium]
MGYKVAVVGATGAVGQQMLAILEQRRFAVDELVPLASPRSAGATVTFRGEQHPVRVLDEHSFEGVQVALFSAGGSVSEAFAPAAAAAGAVVVDNTSAFRMAPDVPLVVPEVNGSAALAAVKDGARRIIANPNCSTIQMVVALAPIHRAVGVERVIVSTYQSVSGAGAKAIAELADQMKHWAADPTAPLPEPKKFPHPMLFECLPQIGDFLAEDEGDSTEERKMINETRKIFDVPTMRVSATTVRVPVMSCHCESVNVETRTRIDPDEARALLRAADGVEVIDDAPNAAYPLARRAAGQDAVYVGRIRRDPSHDSALNMWIVSDNLRKGAALNAIQIAELLHEAGAL